MLRLFDTHTHFDVEDFDHDRSELAMDAYHAGIHDLILIGFLQHRFPNLLSTQHSLSSLPNTPRIHLAPGLHPFYIEQHQASHLEDLDHFLKSQSCIAIGEIGLDSFLKEHKQPAVKLSQQYFFNAQLELAKHHQKPVLLHIRKSHGDTLHILKQHKFEYGGIAHAFSGGVEEAKAFVKMGFKIGVTGQITNPNAKRLIDVVKALSIEDLVLETDCPDMTPLCCQISSEHRTRNTPVNLPYVLDGLAQVLGIERDVLAEQLLKNTLSCLHLSP